MPRHSTETKWCAVALKKYTQLPDRDIAQKLQIKPREVQRIYARYKDYGDVKDRSGGDQKSLAKLGARYFLKKQKSSQNKDSVSEGESIESDRSPAHTKQTHTSNFVSDVAPRPPTPSSFTMYSPPITPYQPSVSSGTAISSISCIEDTTRSVEKAGSVFVTPPTTQSSQNTPSNPPTSIPNVITTPLISQLPHRLPNTTCTTTNPICNSTIDIINCTIKTSPITTHNFNNNVVSVATIPMISSIQVDKNQQKLPSPKEDNEKSLLTQVLLRNLNRKGIVACEPDINELQTDPSCNIKSNNLSCDEDDCEDERSEPETLPSTLFNDASDDDFDNDITTDDEDGDSVEDV